MWLNGIWCPASDAVWLFFSNKLVWIPLYLVVLFFFFRRLGWKRALVAIAALALTILCCDQLAGVFKILDKRPLPRGTGASLCLREAFPAIDRRLISSQYG